MYKRQRLTYTKVWHMLQGDQELREHYAPLVKHIEELHALYKLSLIHIFEEWTLALPSQMPRS